MIVNSLLFQKVVLRFTTCLCIAFLTPFLLQAQDAETIFEQPLETKKRSFWFSHYLQEEDLLSVIVKDSRMTKAYLFDVSENKIVAEHSFRNLSVFKGFKPVAAFKQSEGNLIKWVYILNEKLVGLTIDFDKKTLNYTGIESSFNPSKHTYIRHYYQDGSIRIIYGNQEEKKIHIIKIAADMTTEEQSFDVSEYADLVDLFQKTWALQQRLPGGEHLMNTSAYRKIYLFDRKLTLSYESYKNKCTTEIFNFDLLTGKVSHESIPFDYPISSKKSSLNLVSYIYKNYLVQGWDMKKRCSLSIMDITSKKVLKKLEFSETNLPDLPIGYSIETPNAGKDYAKYRGEVKIGYQAALRWHVFHLRKPGIVVNERSDGLLDLRYGFVLATEKPTLYSHINSNYRNSTGNLSAAGPLAQAFANESLLTRGALQQLPLSNGLFTRAQHQTFSMNMTLDPKDSLSLKAEQIEDTIYDRWIQYQHQIDLRKEGSCFFQKDGATYFGFYSIAQKKYSIVKLLTPSVN